MLFSTRTAISLLFVASAVSARVDGKKRQHEVDANWEEDLAKRSDVVVPEGMNHLQKRDWFSCFFYGQCGSSIDTTSDKNNCGSVGNVCPSTYSNGFGSVSCYNSVCTSACNAGYTFVPASSSYSGGCVMLTSDPNNCGRVGTVCSGANSASNSCVSSSCQIDSCNSGYTKTGSGSSATCVKNPSTADYSSDVSNCGSKGNVCNSSNVPNGKTFACSSGNCVAATCTSGYTINASKSCVNTANDANNCGKADNVCSSVSNGGVSCVNSKCTTTCASGYGLTSTGSCTPTSSDINNCGSVGNVCSSKNVANGATFTCNNGQCQAASCASGYAVNSSGGCTAPNTQTDSNNCGKIGNQCNIPGATAQSCVAGTCKASACDASQYNYSSSAGTCTKFNTDTDSNNCGKAGNVCNVSGAKTQSCVGGTCTASACNSGYTLSSGQCNAIDTTSDSKNCGKIGNACTTPTGATGVSCSNSQCVATGCSSSYSFDSNAGTCTAINKQTDVNNCGTIGNKCAIDGSTGVQCSAGTCKATGCESNYTFSSSAGTCTAINTNTDSNNCGKVGNVCNVTGASKQSCVAGTCTASACSSGYTLSSGQCNAIDTTSDAKNCGAVGKACTTPAGATGVACSNSQCVATGCSSSYSFNAAAGTCTAINTKSDVNNCGTVGNQCSIDGSSGVQCSAGVCKATGCNSGYTFSSTAGTCTAVNTQSDSNNCGSLGNVCNVAGAKTQSCVAGTCTATACNSGYTLASGQCTAIDTTSDAKNCGRVGNACSTPAGATGVACSNSQCVATGCTSSYTYSSSAGTCTSINTLTDVNNCGKVGNVCNLDGAKTQYCSLGVCRPSACNDGYMITVFGTCAARDTTSDVNNCGSWGNACAVAGAKTQACVNSQCMATTCNSGYALSNGACSQVDTTSDVKNCGAVGKACATPTGATGVSCSNSQCVATGCSSTYTFNSASGTCTAINTASDVNNCGSVGKVCSVDGSSGVQCSAGMCKATGCNSGYTFSSTAGTCTAVNTQTDANNCGSVGNVCNIPNAKTQYCSSGICRPSACNSGYRIMVDGTCSAIDTTSDTNNCGSVGKVCSTPAGATGVACSNSQCVATGCTSSYTFSSSAGTCTAINTLTDVNNCGSVGNACALANAKTQYCYAGFCRPSACNDGYMITAFGTCAARDTTSDVNNCGSWGNACAVAGAKTQACVNSQCVATTCNSGYALSSGTCSQVDTTSDLNNCGSVGNKCAVANAAAQTCSNGQCKATSCATSYTLTSSGTCSYINTQSDVNNCGSVGNACNLQGAFTQICNAGQCQATWCDMGYFLWNGKCLNLSNDVNNCGTFGNVCPAKGGVAQCSAGQCSMASCNAGYTLKNGVCYQANGSAAARAKRSKISKPVALCPGTEQACPIVGSASFVLAQASGFSAFKAGDLSAAAGGYECLDTQYSLESCGGCTSMGEGQNCLAIANSSGVGCSAGVCQVFSCEAGYKPNLDATGCVKVPASHRSRRSQSRRADHSHP